MKKKKLYKSCIWCIEKHRISIEDIFISQALGKIKT